MNKIKEWIPAGVFVVAVILMPVICYHMFWSDAAIARWETSRKEQHIAKAEEAHRGGEKYTNQWWVYNKSERILTSNNVTLLKIEGTTRYEKDGVSKSYIDAPLCISAAPIHIGDDCVFLGHFTNASEGLAVFKEFKRTNSTRTPIVILGPK